MSKLTNLITALVLGTSSIAAADPGFSFSASASWDASVSSGPVVRDHRYDDSFRRPTRLTWVALSEPVRAGRRTIIHVPENNDLLGAIKLQLVGGQTYVYDVDVRFEDGTRKTIAVNKWLYSRSPVIQLDLASRASVDMIRIRSWDGANGTFQVFGQARYREMPQPLPLPQPPVYQPPARPMFLAGQALTFQNTIGYKYVEVGIDKGRFSTMRIQPTSGMIHLTYVQICFANGTSQVLYPHTTIGSHTYRDFQLDGNGANQITQVILRTNDTQTVVTDPSMFNLLLF